MALAAGVLAAAVACAPWRAGPLPAPGAPPPPPAAERRGLRTRVVLRDGRRIELRALMVLGDSVVGYRGPSDEPRWRFAVPVRDVARVERADFRPVNALTAGAALTLVAAFAVAVAASLWALAHI